MPSSGDIWNETALIPMYQFWNEINTLHDLKPHPNEAKFNSFMEVGGK